MDESLLGDFITETQDLLQEMETSVLRLEENFDDKELVDDIFRSIHTIKGSSEYLGMARIAEVAHKLENLLDLVRRKKRPADKRIVQLLMDTGDRINILLQEVAAQGAEETSVDDLVAAIEALRSPGSSEPPALHHHTDDINGNRGEMAEDCSENDATLAIMEDEDEELLAIFMEQFKEGYLRFQQEIEQLAHSQGAERNMAGPIECISALRSSANYMGYDTLCRLYDQWVEQIKEAEPILSSGTAGCVAEFVRTAILPTARRLAAVFPSHLIDFPLDVDIPADSAGAAVPDAGGSDAPDDLLEAAAFDLITTETTDAVIATENITEYEEEELSLTGDFLGETPPETETPVEAAYDEAELRKNFSEEYDRDLYEIFAEQHKTHLQAIHAELENVFCDHPLRGIVDNCLVHISRLKASANYMGYDGLCALYDNWRDDIDAFMNGAGDDDPMSGSLFVSGCMDPWVRKIDELFDMPAGDLQTEPEFAAAEADEVPESVHRPPYDDAATEETDTDSLLDAVFSDEDTLQYDDSPPELDAAPEPCDPNASIDIAVSDEETDLFQKLGSAFTAGLPAPLETDTGTSPTEPTAELFSDPSETEEIPTPPTMEDLESLSPENTGDEFPDVFQDMHAEMLRMQLEPDPAPLSEIFDVSPDPVIPENDETDNMSARPDGAPAEAVMPFPFSDDTPDQSKAPKKAIKQNIRVDAAKIDLLMNQVGELVVNRSVFTQLTNDLQSLQQYLKHELNLDKRELTPIKNLAFKLGEATISLGRVANELQESVMKVRMLPISQLFDRYPRLIHDLTRKSDKKVHLEVTGADTELDRMVIEEISDPLVHIIRNAVDHGIEAPDLRKASDKPETGTVSIAAYHESNHVIIEISDDGQGLDLEKIRTKAVQSEILQESEAGRMSSAELSTLITVPGFSTADAVTHTSGRGVGMDVVKKNIESLNGTLEIHSIPGKETRFRIKIPLTLAIFPALLVRVEDEVYTIPMSAVEETIRIREQDITVMDGVEVIQLRDAPISLLPLPKLFNKRSQLYTDSDHLYVVVVNNGDMQVGLIVDALIRKEEVVIKPLEDYLQENSGFSGATILGDGRISLILDVYELVKLTLDRKARMAADAVI